MRSYNLLSDDQKLALSVIGRDDKVFADFFSIFQNELDGVLKQYETAKEALVATGENRSACLHMRGQISALQSIISILTDSRKI